MDDVTLETKTVGMTYTMDPDIAYEESVMTFIYQEALEKFAEHGTVLKNTIRSHIVEPDPTNPANYREDGTYNPWVLVAIQAEVISLDECE